VKQRKKAKKAKRQQWSKLVFICPHCQAATVLEQPVQAIAYGMHRLPKEGQ